RCLCLIPFSQRTRGVLVAGLLDVASLKRYTLWGPDWFTSAVRMGTVIVQGVTKRFEKGHHISTMVLAGQNRIFAQNGHRPLTQLEAALRQTVTQERCEQDSEKNIQVLSSNWDIDLLNRINENSVSLADVSEHARGDEINADGLLWRCGNCMAYTVPGEK